MGTRIEPNSLAMDSNALNGLKRSAQNESPESIRAAAKQFEAVLMNMMLKSMRDTVPQDGAMDNEQSKMFMGMLDQQLSSQLSQKGLGLSEVLAKQLSKLSQGTTLPPAGGKTANPALQATLLPQTANLKPNTEATLVNAAQTAQQPTLDHALSMPSAHLRSDVPGATGVAAFLNQPTLPSAPTSAEMVNSRDLHGLNAGPDNAKHAMTTQMLAGTRAATQKLVQAYQALEAYQAQFSAAEPLAFPALSPAQFSQAFVQKATDVANQAASKTEQFISRMMPHAEAASVMSGIPAKFMVGQAALESGWGKHAITTAEGQASHNLFGIKADASWKGKVATSVTTEYINGVKQNRVEKFRAYDSYTDAFFDYARLISQQPRYQQAMQNTHDAHAYAHALQRAGYATDPHYGQKLAGLIARMRT